MNVLLLGDSHTHGTYGQALEALFKAAGHAVTRVGWVSATAGHYLKGTYKKLKLGHTGDYDSQVKGKNFDLAVVSLGTNEAGGVSNAAQAQAAIANIQKLIGTFSAGAVFWVGPPAFSATAAKTYNPAFAKMDLNQRAALIWNAGAAAFGNRAIDPRAATQAHTLAKDIHLGPAGGKAWAQAVFGSTTGAAAAVPVPPDPADASAGSGIPEGAIARPFPWMPVLIGGGVLALGLVAYAIIRRGRRSSLPATLRPTAESAEQQTPELTVPLPEAAPILPEAGPMIAPEPVPVAGLFKKWSR